MSQQQLAWSNSVPAGDNGRQPLQHSWGNKCAQQIRNQLAWQVTHQMEKQKTMDKDCHCNTAPKLYEAGYQRMVANNNDVELPGVERDQNKLDPTKKNESQQHTRR